MKTLTAVLAVLLLTAAPVCARIINIPDDFETIQAGIDATEEGDTVLVENGVYEETVNFSGKAITVASLILLDDDGEHIENTVIDGSDERPGAIFYSQEGNDSILKGFTIRNCIVGRYFGSGISCYNEASPTLSDLIVRDNQSWPIAALWLCYPVLMNIIVEQNGGGIFLRSGIERVVIRNCEIRNNDGTGLICNEATVHLIESLISGNIGTGHQQFAGGVDLGFSHDNIFINVSIIGNTATNEDGAGGIFFGSFHDGAGSTLTMVNSIVYDNVPTQIGIWVRGEGPEIASLACDYCDVENGEEGINVGFGNRVEWGDGNIDEDPLFADPENGDYHPTADSPCIDAGDPESDPDPDGSRADMGAFYFHQRDIEVEPLELLFPPIHWGELDSLPVTITNDGGTDLTIISVEGCLTMSCIWMNEEDPEVWQPIVMEPLQNIQLWVYYHPQEGAVRERTFWIRSNDPDEPEVTVHARGEVENVNEGDVGLPLSFELIGVSPNPFNSQTTVHFALPHPDCVRFILCDLSGRIVWSSSGGLFQSGRNMLMISGEALPAGVYLLKLTSRTGNNIWAKLVLMK